MKKFIFIITFILTTTIMSAQEFGGPMGMPPMGEGPGPGMDSTKVEVSQTTDPKSYGRHEANLLKEKAGLTDDQYEAVFKLYRNEMMALNNSQAMSSASSDPISMIMNGNGMTPNASSGSSQSKRVEKRNKKMSKILDTSQYDIYIKMQESGEID